MNYDPKSDMIDTTGYTLPAELTPVREQLAAHIHGKWAEERMNQGWSWGAKRDDATKQHPCLVPYRDLSDGEKEFDRATAEASILGIQACGATITFMK